MAQKTPLVYDDVGMVHTPLPTGDTLDPAALPFATLEEVVEGVEDSKVVSPATVASVALRRAPLGTTLWVRPDGDDNNDGRSNTPELAFRTITAAIEAAVTRYWLGGVGIAIRLGVAGTYEEFATPNVSGKISVLGNTPDPSQYIIRGWGNNGAIARVTGMNVTLRYVTIINDSTSSHDIGVSDGGMLQADTVICGGESLTDNSASIMAATAGGRILVTGINMLQHSAVAAFAASSGGSISMYGQVMFLAGMEFSGAVIMADTTALVQFTTASRLVGAVTGVRYNVSLNAVINTNGAGANWIPGSEPGVSIAGGQYA